MNNVTNAPIATRRRNTPKCRLQKSPWNRHSDVESYSSFVYTSSKGSLYRSYPFSRLFHQPERYGEPTVNSDLARILTHSGPVQEKENLYWDCPMSLTNGVSSKFTANLIYHQTAPLTSRLTIHSSIDHSAIRAFAHQIHVRGMCGRRKILRQAFCLLNHSGTDTDVAR